MSAGRDDGPVQGFYVVMTRPFEGMAQPYHDWYDSKHIPDILAMPGVAFARRYCLSEKAEGPFAAIYGFSDTAVAVREIMRWRGTERLRTSPTVDRSKNKACVFDAPLERIAQLCAGDGLAMALFQAGSAMPARKVGVAATCSPLQASASVPAYSGIHLWTGEEGHLPLSACETYSARPLGQVRWA